MNAEVRTSASQKVFDVQLLQSMSLRRSYQPHFVMFLSFNRCLNARRRKLWGMHLFCIKYELMYSDAKSRDRFISATLSSAARTLGRAEGHVVGLRVAWRWFGQSTNLLIASWGSESPSSSTASIHESRVSWKKKKENKPSRSASRTQTPFYPSSACFLTLWKTSFISVRERLPIDNYALPKFTSLSLFLSGFFSLCAFSTVPSGWTQRKNWRNIPVALLDLPGCRF